MAATAPPPADAPPAPTATAAAPSAGRQHPSTYREMYLDFEQDPYSGDYSAIMQAFATTANPVAATFCRQLTDRVFQKAELELQAYLVVTNIGAENFIQVLHRPSILRAPLSSAAPDHGFAFLGDFRGVQPPQLVEWPSTAFEQTISVNVIRDAAIDTALAADADLLHLGPFADNTAGVVTVTTLRAMYLPARYVPTVIGRVINPRQAWDELGGAIRAETPQEQTDLLPLLNWLKVALIRWDNTAVPANHLQAPRPPAIVTPQIQDHAARVLQNDFPAEATAPAPAGLAPLVGAVNQLTAEVVQTRTEEAARRANATVKTPAQHYGSAVNLICQLCQTADPSELPRLYHVIANSNKRTLRVNIQQHLHGIASRLGLGQYTPIVSPDLAAKLNTASFEHYDINDLEDGIQPFITPAWSNQQKQDLDKNNAAHDTLQEGASARLDDLFALRQFSKINPPVSLLQTQHCFYSFRILLEAILGASHPHCISLNEFIYEFVQALPELEIHALRKNYFSIRLVRYVQIRFSTWVNLQWNSAAEVPPPPYEAVLMQIRYQETSWEPLIPRRYLPAPTNPGAPAAPVHQPAPPAHGTPAPAPAAPGRTRERVQNTRFDSAYQTYQDRRVPLSVIRANASQANKTPPTNAQGTEVCLCWHLLGYCWSNCSRLGDHRPQSAAEKTATLAFLDSCCRPAQGPSPSPAAAPAGP